MKRLTIMTIIAALSLCGCGTQIPGTEYSADQRAAVEQALAMSMYRDEAADLRGQLKAYRAMAVIPSEPAKEAGK